MADWYVSSATFATQTAWQALTAYTVGQFVKATAPAEQHKYVFRCTTAGTTAAVEPTWPTGNNSTVTDGTVVWTNVSGQSAYFWGAAAGDLVSLAGRWGTSDRTFLSSDHTETSTSSITYGSGFVVRSNMILEVLSVNRAGSTPPVTADLLAGATIINTNVLTFGGYVRMYWSGVTFEVTGSGNIQWNADTETFYYSNCLLWLNTTSTSASILATSLNGSDQITWDNTSLKFGHIAQGIKTAPSCTGHITWINTATPIQGSIFPTNLFLPPAQNQVICKGVDFSSFTNTLVAVSAAGSSQRFLFQGCKVSPSVTFYNATSAVSARDIVEVVNCYDGTHILNSCYQPTGTVTTDTSVTMVGGALDHNGHYSHKLASNANANKFGTPLDSFWLDIENIITGTSKTATIEIISSTTLNNDEISFWLEYQNTAGTPVSTVATSLIGVLDTPSAIATSGLSWNSPPATPVTQHLQITFTPQNAGRVRGQVRLGKPSTTVWINPQILIT